MEPRLTVRIDFAGGRRVGPGMVRLLELIDETCPISGAAAPWPWPTGRLLLVDS